MSEVMDTMFEGKEKEEIKAKIKQMPLSDSTASRHTEVLAGDLVKQLCDGIKNAECISLVVDESTDTTDNAQLMVFVRYMMSQKGSLLKMCWVWQTSVHRQGVKTFTMQYWKC